MSTMQQIFQKIKTDITKSNPTVPGLIQRLSDYSDELSHASGGSGGDSVEVTQIQSTGTKIASVAVNGVGTDLYSPDVSVTQTVSTGTKIGSVNGTDLYSPAVTAGDVAITAISGITGDDVQDALEALQSNKANTSDLNNKVIFATDNLTACTINKQVDDELRIYGATGAGGTNVDGSLRIRFTSSNIKLDKYDGTTWNTLKTWS